MSIEGDRGRIRWGRGLLADFQPVTLDAVEVKFGLMVPFVLGGVVHVWDLPVLRGGGPGKAIRLRDDPAFRRQVLRQGPVVLGGLAVAFALFMLGIGLMVNLRFVPCGVAFAASLVAVGLVVWLNRTTAAEKRHRDIRLLLGRHEWGGSDPATWANALVADVEVPAEGFAAVAERERAAGNWAEAMWAARLCAAAEDQAKGEALTDTILGEAEVAEKLRRVRRKPDTRDAEFGDAPGLGEWVRCNPRKHVFAIG